MNIHPFQVIVAAIESLAVQGGYTFLFLISTLEAVPFIGSAIPGHTAVILAGFLSRIGLFNVWIVMFIATLGAVAGDMIGFYMGKKYGLKMVEKFKDNAFFKEEYINKAQYLIGKHTGKALIFGRFNPLSRPFIPLLVGASHSSEAKFWFYNILGGTLWAVLSVLVGYVFGVGYHAAAGYFGKAVMAVTIMAILIVWGYYFVNIRFHIFRKYELFMLILNILALLGLVKTVQDAWANQSNLAAFDVLVNIFVSTHMSVPLMMVADLISNLGSVTVLSWIGFIVGAAFLARSKWRSGVIMISSVLTAGISVELLKAVFMRDRPENAIHLILNDPSFPSGHAAIAAAFFLAIAYLFAPKISSLIKRELMITGCVLAAIIVGFSRILLSVHWSSDVIAGWSLGIFCTSASVLLVRYVGTLLIYKKKFF